VSRTASSHAAAKLSWIEVSSGASRWYEASVPVRDGPPTIPLALLTIEPRPAHCDRGRWIAKCFRDPRDGRPLDGQEGWPRYYFDLDRARAEIQEWVEARLR
jgi:hypothetical protein